MSPPFRQAEDHLPGLKQLESIMSSEQKPFAIVLETKDSISTTNPEDLYVFHAIYRTQSSPPFIFWVSRTWKPSGTGAGTIGFLEYAPPTDPPTPSVDFFGSTPKKAYEHAVKKVGSFEFAGVEQINFGEDSDVYNKGRCWVFFPKRLPNARSGIAKVHEARAGKTVLVAITKNGKYIEGDPYVRELVGDDLEEYNRISVAWLEPTAQDTEKFMAEVYMGIL